jgi:hypothetical protein
MIKSKGQMMLPFNRIAFIIPNALVSKRETMAALKLVEMMSMLILHNKLT